jgi:sulfonate transport system permease protein
MLAVAIQFLRQKLTPWLVPAVLVALWEVAWRLHWLPPSESAAPSAILSHLLSRTLFVNATWTLLRLVSGVIAGTLVGIASGLFLSQNRRASRLLSPTLQFLAPIPIIVWLPFIIIVFGVGDPMRVAFVATAAYFLAHVHCFHAARAVDRDFVELGQIYEKRYWSRLWQIILPSSSASIFTAVRIALAMGWIVVAFAEFGLQEPGREGIGYFVMQARALGQVENEFAGIVLLGIIGALVDLGVVTIEKHFLRWANTAEERI